MKKIDLDELRSMVAYQRENMPGIIEWIQLNAALTRAKYNALIKEGFTETKARAREEQRRAKAIGNVELVTLTTSGGVEGHALDLTLLRTGRPDGLYRPQGKPQAGIKPGPPTIYLPVLGTCCNEQRTHIPI